MPFKIQGNLNNIKYTLMMKFFNIVIVHADYFHVFMYMRDYMDYHISK